MPDDEGPIRRARRALHLCCWMIRVHVRGALQLRAGTKAGHRRTAESSPACLLLSGLSPCCLDSCPALAPSGSRPVRPTQQQLGLAVPCARCSVLAFSRLLSPVGDVLDRLSMVGEHVCVSGFMQNRQVYRHVYTITYAMHNVRGSPSIQE